MISEETIKKISHLARLELTPAEVALYSKQLGSILDYVSQLSKVNTDNIEPLVTPTDMPSTMRSDEVQKSLDADLIVLNAPEKSGHLFKVPPVL